MPVSKRTAPSWIYFFTWWTLLPILARAGAIFGQTTIRGVNLGGWTVLEPWITPSLFSSKPSWVVDELTYGQYWRQTSLKNGTLEIQNHWTTWITEQDISNIADAGLNTIRIPVGYWSIIPLDPTEMFLTGAYPFLQKIVTLAGEYDISVIIDLHGVPGSQNGFDNSGRKNSIGWFQNATDISRTVTAINVLSTEFSASKYGGAVIGMELVNEPYPSQSGDRGALQTLKSYYEQGYSTVRSHSSDICVVLDEAFEGLPEWTGFMPSSSFDKVSLDTHIYGMFTAQTVDEGYNDHLATYCGWHDSLVQANIAHWTFVGEFTPSPNDCAQWLNGRGSGSRYDGSLVGQVPPLTGSCKGKSGPAASFDADYIAFLAQSFETQTWVYEQASGWIMWTYKTESAADWSFEQGLTYGWQVALQIAKT